MLDLHLQRFGAASLQLLQPLLSLLVELLQLVHLSLLNLH